MEYFIKIRLNAFKKQPKEVKAMAIKTLLYYDSVDVSKDIYYDFNYYY